MVPVLLLAALVALILVVILVVLVVLLLVLVMVLLLVVVVRHCGDRGQRGGERSELEKQVGVGDDGAATSRVESTADTDYKGPAVAPGYKWFPSVYEQVVKVSGGGICQVSSQGEPLVEI